MPRIRQATTADVPAIRRIARESWHAAYDEFLGPETVDERIDDWYALDGLAESVRAAGDCGERSSEGARGSEAARPRTAKRRTASGASRERAKRLRTPEDRTVTDGSRTERVFVVAEAAIDAEDERSSSAVVGFAQAGPNPDEERIAMLYRIYVEPAAWGEGIGSALLERLEADLPDRFERLRLAVLADNEVGVSFYESTGFERATARECGFDADLEEYVYEKPLSASRTVDE